MLPRLLITGGSGLLAKSWTYARLNKNTIYLVEHKNPCVLPGTTPLKVNLESIDEIIFALKSNSIDICVHTAGLTSVELCESNPAMAEYANTLLAKNVAIACSRLQIPLIAISTDHLFSGKSPMTNEDEIVEPMNVYASTKARGEIAILQSYPTALIVRTNFYGWGYGRRPSFSDYIFNNLEGNKSVGLFTDIFYTPIIATSLANICHDLIELGAQGIYNVVGSERLTKFDFGMKLASIFNLNSQLIKSSQFNHMSHLINRPRDMSLSNAKALNIIGYSLPSLDDQLRQLKAQYLDGFFQQ